MTIFTVAGGIALAFFGLLVLEVIVMGSVPLYVWLDEHARWVIDAFKFVLLLVGALIGVGFLTLMESLRK
jgi:hypothetical protein